MPAVKKIVLWTVLPFLSLNVLIGLACGVLFVFD